MKIDICRKPFVFFLYIALSLTAQAQLQSVTYTIRGIDAVEITGGQAPQLSSADYSQSGNTLGKMSAYESTTLVLSGYEGNTIKKLVLKMHSDKKQGAGGLDVKVADRRICQIPSGCTFNSNWWFGTYFNYFVDVTPAMRDTLYEIKEGQDVTIHIMASQNNLYLESYTLYYEKIVYPSYQVTYSVNGHRTTLDSNRPFAEILPLKLQNPIEESDKVFIGWAVTEAPVFPDDFIDLSQHPVSDTVVYAIFGNVDYQEDNLLTSLTVNERNDAWEYTSCENLNSSFFDITLNTEIFSPLLYLPAITSIKADVGFHNFNGLDLPLFVSDEAGNVVDTFHVTQSDYFLYDMASLKMSDNSYGCLCFTIDAAAQGLLESSGIKCRGLYIYYKPYFFNQMTSLISGAHIVHVKEEGFTFDAGLLKPQMAAIQLQNGTGQPYLVSSFQSHSDGTYSVDFPFVANPADIISIGFLDSDGQLLETISFVMPLIVTTNRALTEVPECDLFVRNEAVCAVAEDIQLDDVEIAPGASLVVNEGVHLSVASLRMRSENDTVARFYLKGTMENRTNRLFFDKKMDNQAFYFFSLPDTCGLSQISFSSGEKAVHGRDYLIKYYDGEQRIINQGTASNWKMLSDTVLYPGVGYIIAVAAPNGVMQELRFSLDYKAAVAEEGKFVPIYPHGAQLFNANELDANHVGWNLVGNPSLRTFENESGVFYSYNATTDEVQAIPYFSYPIDRGTTYAQEECAGDFPAFTSFFVQIGAQSGEETHDYFFQCSPKKEQSLFRTAPFEEMERQKVTLQVSCDDRSDKTVVWLDDENTADYEIGKDLEKMMGVAACPHIFSVNGEVRLAFQALPTAARHAIPIGAYFPSAGEYTIVTLPVENNGMENGKVWLTDLHTGQVIDLLQHGYTFYVDNAGLDNRFILSVEPYSEVPTEFLHSKDKIEVYAHMGDLVLNGLRPNTDVRLFDAGGRLLFAGTAHANEYSIPARQKGVYFIRLEWNNEFFYLRAVL